MGGWGVNEVLGFQNALVVCIVWNWSRVSCEVLVSSGHHTWDRYGVFGEHPKDAEESEA